MTENYAGNVCTSCQMFLENTELLALHSCVEVKQEMSDLDKTISGDPLYVYKNQTDIKVEEGKDQLDSIIDMVHEHNLKVQDGKNLHDENALKQEEKDRLNKNTTEVCEEENELVQKQNYLPAYKYLCDICEKPFSKSYLKAHMLNKHSGQYRKDPNSNNENVHEQKNQLIVKNFKRADEEIMCPKCNANFRTIRRLRIHIEEAHEKNIETISAPKAKRQKVDGAKFLPLVCPHCEKSFSRSDHLKHHIMKLHEVVLPPKPYEKFTNGRIFDYLYLTLKIFPTNTEYNKHVKDTVLSFKNISIDKLIDSSVKTFDKKVQYLVGDLRKMWRKCGCHRDIIYKRFQNKMDYTFDWTPELKQDFKENEDKNKHLSDEFLTSILEQINDACDKICNVDVDLERQKEFRQNLKNVTNCYQKILTNRQANL